MVEDTPDELLGELFNAAYFPNQPLGRPIEGTKETVPTFDQKRRSHSTREFSYNTLVVAAAGNVEHARLVELAGRCLRRLRKRCGFSAATARRLEPRPAAPILIEQKNELNKRIRPGDSLACRAQRRSLRGESVGGGDRRRHVEPSLAAGA